MNAVTVVLLALVVGGTVGGDLLKAYGMRRQGSPDSFRAKALGRFAAATVANPWFLLALLAYTVSFVGFIALVSIHDVSFAVPATALGYVVETLLARWILREAVSLRRWTGAALVVAGVWLIA